MKTKLKTLKDLGMERIDTRINDVLKAEVVKWVKEFKKRDDDENKQSWIKHFFNLTEEDLQEKTND